MYKKSDARAGEECYNLRVRIIELRDSMKKWLAVMMMAILMLVVAGCGSDNALDDYSFGHKVIRQGASEVTFALPFDIGVQPNMTKNALGYPVVTYMGGDNNFLVVIEAVSPRQGQQLPTAAAYTNELKALYEKGLGSSADWTVKNVALDGVPAETVNGTLTMQNKKFSFFQYTFVSNGVLWNITYQYPANSTLGAQIADFVIGKIQITKKEG